MNNEEELLLNVKRMVSDNPRLFGIIVMACSEGIERRVSVEMERAADFESIAAAHMAIASEPRKTKTTTEWANALIESKMSKWKNKTSNNF